jgi:hypothetical protein
MTKIYELNQAQQELLDRLYWLNDDDPADNEEIESIKKELSKVRDSAENTIQFLSGLLLSFNYDTSVHDDEVKRLLALADKAKKRKQKAEKNAERIENIMLYMFKKFDIGKVSTKHGDFAPTITPGAVVYADDFDIDYIPENFVTMVPSYKEPVTKEIMAFLRSKIYDPETKKLDTNTTTVYDHGIPGVSLVRKEGVKIK